MTFPQKRLTNLTLIGFHFRMFSLRISAVRLSYTLGLVRRIKSDSVQQRSEQYLEGPLLLWISILRIFLWLIEALLESKLQSLQQRLLLEHIVATGKTY